MTRLLTALLITMTVAHGGSRPVTVPTDETTTSSSIEA